ncbi:hypothetical protein FRC00_011334 [Tulasnella sp. 408]|nr:hypothetical protein FRC00_011334 [Tulasnella sp. 408]
MGKAYRSLSELEDAEISYLRAQQIYDSLECDLEKANTLRGLAEIQRLQARYGDAEESLAVAQAIYYSLGNDLGQANALLGLGQMNYRKGNYAEAKASFSQARELYSKINHDLGQANALDGLGKTCFEQHKYKQSKDFYSKARSIYSRIGKRISEVSEVRWKALLALDKVTKDLGYTPSYVKMKLGQEAKALMKKYQGKGVTQWKDDWVLFWVWER